MRIARWTVIVAISLAAATTAFGQNSYKLVEQVELTKGALCGSEKPGKTQGIRGQIVKREFAADGKTLSGITVKDKHGQDHDIRIDGDFISERFSPAIIQNIYSVFGQDRFVKVFADVCGSTLVARKVEKKKSS